MRKRTFKEKFEAWSWGFTNTPALNVYDANREPDQVHGLFIFAASVLAPLQVLRAAASSAFKYLVVSDPTRLELITSLVPPISRILDVLDKPYGPDSENNYEISPATRQKSFSLIINKRGQSIDQRQEEFLAHLGSLQDPDTDDLSYTADQLNTICNVFVIEAETYSKRQAGYGAALQNATTSKTIDELSLFVRALTYRDNGIDHRVYTDEEIQTIANNFAASELSYGNIMFILYMHVISFIILQGAAVYASVYGLQCFCFTYIEGIASPITHGLLSSIAGIWLTIDMHCYGIVIGLLIGVTAFAIQQYALPALAEAVASSYPLSELDLHLIGGAMTILAIMPIVLLINMVGNKLSGPPKEGFIPDFRFEFPILGLLVSKPEAEQART